MDKIVVSYQDSCLYASDIEILKCETAWLNDRIISFYLDFLQNENYESSEILFIGCEVTQAIKMLQNPDEINAVILEPLNVSSKNFIIFPINDNTRDKAGGSHWSLLVFSRPEGKFFHFDSAGSMNFHVCSSFVRILKACLKMTQEEGECVQVDCLQQNNSYDCGIFVLCHIDHVCKIIMRHNRLSNMPTKIPFGAVNVKRQEILQIATGLGANVKTNL